MASVDQLIPDSEQIRDETTPGANTANRIGSLFLSLSELLPAGNINDGIMAIPINGVTVPRNGLLNVAELDFTIFPAGFRAASFSFEWDITAYTNLNSGSNGQAIMNTRGRSLWLLNNSGTSWIDAPLYSYLSPDATLEAPYTKFTDVIVNASFVSASRFLIEFENLMTGTGTENPNYTGTLIFRFNPNMALPPITML
jgi:hypothetical protein